MKRFLSLWIAVFLAMTMLSGAAWAENPEYPAVRIDPSTGKAWDLGGKTVYIFDWWTGNTWQDDNTNLTEQEQATYDYRTWIQDTYNCTVVTGMEGDWGTIGKCLVDFAADPDGSWRIYTLPSDTISGVINSNVLANWNKSTSVSMSASKWNGAVNQFMTVGNKLLGTRVGGSEPRQVLYFNKRVLTEAGIDWNDIYDMQKNGTWTFSALDNLLGLVQRDTDGDGELDVFGITGSRDDLLRIAVFANGGSFFDLDESGKLIVTVGSEKSVQALNWAKAMWSAYAYKQRENDNWDYFKTAWLQGTCAFYIHQAYAGFDGYSEMANMEDDWGCVAFPKGPQGTRYVTIVNDNVIVIPNVYSQDILSKITLIYDLWTDPTPGYFSGDEWIGNKYNLTDERAVDETYAMLRQAENTVMDLVYMLGQCLDVEGPLLWSMGDDTDVDELVEAVSHGWENQTEYYNIKSGDYDTLALPDDAKVIEDYAFYAINAQVVIVPDGCVSIGAMAFADNERLLYVVLPENLTDIAPDAFSGSNPKIIRK